MDIITSSIIKLFTLTFQPIAKVIKYHDMVSGW